MPTTTTTTPAQPTPAPIPIVAIGKTRATALQLGSIFSARGTQYYLAAVLDMTESPKEHQFSEQSLGAVLWAMSPRCKAVACGTAIGEDLLVGIERAWGEFVEGGGLDAEGERKGKGKGGVVALHRWHPTTGPPPPGLEDELLRQLDAMFR